MYSEILNYWPTHYFNCYSCVIERVSSPSNIFRIHPGIKLLTVISQGHWVNQQTTCPMVWRSIYTCSSFKYVQHIIPVPVVIYYWISSSHILIPHYTIWSSRWILIVIITARDNKTGTQQSFDISWHCYLPSTGAAQNISCKRIMTQWEKLKYKTHTNTRVYIYIYWNDHT